VTVITIGVDIGGTKIAAARVRADGTVDARARTATPRTGADDILDATLHLIAGLRARGVAESEVSAIGVGAPGIIAPGTGRVLIASSVVPGWTGTEVAARLAAATGLAVHVDNDVRAMAQGEATLGAGRDLGDVLYASFGTGVGGALSFDGVVRPGHQGTAGELAHLAVGGPGPIACGCGSRTHLEAAASGPAIAAAYAARTGTGLELVEVARRSASGDAAAAEVIEEAARTAGAALAGLITAVDLDGLVLAGGVLNIGDRFAHTLEQALRSQLWPPDRRLVIRRAALGEDAPVIGAALMAGRRT
jgi:glucokinase